MNTDQLKAARLQKALDRLYNFDGQIMTLGQYIASKHIIRKSAYTRTHETHKRDCMYKELAAPKTEYTLWYMDGDRELGIDVPKLVYDSVVYGNGLNLDDMQKVHDFIAQPCSPGPERIQRPEYEPHPETPNYHWCNQTQCYILDHNPA